MRAKHLIACILLALPMLARAQDTNLYGLATWYTNAAGLVWAYDTNAVVCPSLYTPGTNGWMLFGLLGGMQSAWISQGTTTNDWAIYGPATNAAQYGKQPLGGYSILLNSSIFAQADTNACTTPTAYTPVFIGQPLFGHTAPNAPALWIASMVSTQGWLLLKEWQP